MDPSCGDGAFLGRAIERLLTAYPDLDDARLTQLVHGWEIHAGAADAARTRISAQLQLAGRSERAAVAAARLMVTTGDFLTDGPTTPTYHLIAGNPPFLRYTHLHPVLRQRYEATLPDYSVADMLHSFLARCSDCVMPDGQIGVVTSDRWLYNENAARLREELGRSLGVSGLRRLHNDSAFYRAKTRRAGTLPRVHPVAVVLRPRAVASRPLNRSAIYPDAAGAGMAARTLADVCDVRIAPWLGSKGVFVVDEAVAATLPAACLVPAMDTKDIVTGADGSRAMTTPKRFAIRTYRGAEPTGAVRQHLLSMAGEMAERGRRDQFWVPPETFESFDLSKPHLVVPRIAKSLQAVRVPAGVLPINHNLSIATADDDLDEIEERLRDPRALEWVRERAAPLENSYFSLTTKLLRRLPIF